MLTKVQAMMFRFDESFRHARHDLRQDSFGSFASFLLLAGLIGALTSPLCLRAGEDRLELEGKKRGLSYSHDQIPDGPWSIHMLKVNRSRADFEFHTTLAKGAIMGLGTMTEQIKTLPRHLGRPLAAINGDFWKDAQQDGDPEGLQIMRGELISAPGQRACFWIDNRGRPHATNVLSQFKITWPNKQVTPLGLNEDRVNGNAVLYTAAFGASTRTKKGVELILEREGNGEWLPLRVGQILAARVREVRETGNASLTSDTVVLSLSPQLTECLPVVSTGAVLSIALETTPDLRDVKTAVGGGPALVREGKMLNFTSAPVRHPRTAIGWNDKFFFLVVVDGRQPKLSVGMTLQELAAYMIKQGCQEGLNLDGGGSATFWVFGNVMNSPCYGYERPMANALVLVQKSRNQNGSLEVTEPALTLPLPGPGSEP